MFTSSQNRTKFYYNVKNMLCEVNICIWCVIDLLSGWRPQRNCKKNINPFPWFTILFVFYYDFIFMVNKLIQIKIYDTSHKGKLVSIIYFLFLYKQDIILVLLLLWELKFYMIYAVLYMCTFDLMVILEVFFTSESLFLTNKIRAF